MSSRPKFTPKEYAFGRPGEIKTKKWCDTKEGWHCRALPNGEFGEDLFVRNALETFFLQVERRHLQWLWTLDRFPFAFVNVPEGREIKEGTHLLTLREDMEIGLFISDKDLIFNKPVFCPDGNRKSPKGEWMRKIPFLRCLPVDLSDYSPMPLCILNKNRVETAARTWKSKSSLIKLLGQFPPYGMDLATWREHRERLGLSLWVPENLEGWQGGDMASRPPAWLEEDHARLGSRRQIDNSTFGHV